MQLKKTEEIFRMQCCHTVLNSMTMNCFPIFPTVLFIAKGKRQKGKIENSLQLVGIPMLIGFWLILRKTARAILDD